MWRVRLSNRSLTDMVNRTRAKDAAISFALTSLNARTGDAARSIKQLDDIVEKRAATKAEKAAA
jgi:hypothetical protein